MLNVVSNFDFVERNKGFFKYQQENLHKSNIYSIKLTNTRLNPAQDDVLTTYKTLKSLIEHLTSVIKSNSQNSNTFIFDNKSYSNLYYDYNTNEFKFDNEGSKSLDDVAKILSYKIVYNDLHEFEYAYDINEEREITKKNTIKTNMRKILETAIKNSVSEYMPADTTLWKIIYTGL